MSTIAATIGNWFKFAYKVLEQASEGTDHLYEDHLAERITQLEQRVFAGEKMPALRPSTNADAKKQ